MRFTALTIQMIQPVPEFLHNTTNKKPAEICNSPGGCFKDQDAEKYCLNYNDPTFCKTVGDICDAGGFVKPEGAYCRV